jgi:hypothetical protein
LLFGWLPDGCTSGKGRWLLVWFFCGGVSAVTRRSDGMRLLTSIDRALLLGFGSIASGDEAHNMSVVCQPAVTRDLEQIRTLSWVGHQYALEQISCVGCDVFGEGEWSGNNVLVEKVDVIALRVGWVVVEGQVTCQHGVLRGVSLTCLKIENNVPE